MFLDFLKQVRMCFQLSGGLGVPWHSTTGLPQGASTAGYLLSGIFAPWKKVMQQIDAQPAQIADDLTVQAYGDRATDIVKAAFVASDQFLTMVHLKRQPHKSYIWGLTPACRKRLKDFALKGQVVPRVKHFRLLGAHLNVTKKILNVTFED